MVIRVVNIRNGEVTEREYTQQELDSFAQSEPTPLEKLQKLDSENQLTQRNLRDLVKDLVDAACGLNIDLRNRPLVQKVYATEAQAEELRKQLPKPE